MYFDTERRQVQTRKRQRTLKKEFNDLIKAEGFILQRVFNGDKIGLFWKKFPNRTFLTEEEKVLPGHKPMKDRLTLLMCGNASGDFKVKPILVYHSDNL